MNKKVFLEKLKTRREAESYLGLTTLAMQHHLRTKNIIPCKSYGEGKGKVQLFWEEDLDELKKILKNT